MDSKKLILRLLLFSAFFSTLSVQNARGLDINDCGELDTPNTVYILQNDVQTTGTCFNITADNITLDGNGSQMIGDYSGSSDYGVNTSNALNITIKDFPNISGFIRGIYFDNVNNSLIQNNTFDSTFAATTEAIYLEDSDSNTIENNTIEWNATGAANSFGVYLYVNFGVTAGNNNITNNNLTINSSSSSAVGVYLDNYGTSNSNTISNNTFDIDSASSAYGVYLLNSGAFNNNTIQNNSFDIDGSSAFGVYFDNSGTTVDYTTIQDNSFDIDGQSVTASGIQLANPYGTSLDYTTIQNNTLEVDAGTYAYGVGLLTAGIENSNIIKNNIIKITSSGSSPSFYSYGIHLEDTDYTNASQNTINATAPNALAADVYLKGNSNHGIFSHSTLLGNNYSVNIETNGGVNNTFLNVSYALGIEYVGSGGQMIRKWYYRAYVNNTNGNPLSNARVTAYNITGALILNTTTNSTGWTPIGSLIDYVNNGGTRSYHSNYTINASKIGFVDELIFNVSLNRNNLKHLFTLQSLFIFKEQGSQTRSTYSVAVEDLDNDGDLDYIAGNYNGPNYIYINNGTGYFTIINSTPSAATQSIAIADIDDDGDFDYIEGNNNQPNRIFINNGSGYFSLFESSQESDDTRAIAIADLDNDGDLDYIAGNYNDKNGVYINDGSGHFTLEYNVSSSFEKTLEIAISDLNNDGYPDYISGNYGNGNRIYFNDGNGDFTFVGSIGGSKNTRSVSIADIDNDGDPDIVIGDSNDVNLVYTNNGSGNFVFHSDIPETDNTFSITIADIDNDEDLDYIEGNEVEPNRVFINNGSGYFSLFESSQESDDTRAIAIADLDNDGDLDYIAGNSLQNKIYENKNNNNYYLKIIIITSSGNINRYGIGTKVHTSDLNGNLIGYREVTSGDSSQDGTTQLHFGISSLSNFTANATFITGKIVSCLVQPSISFKLYENGSASNNVSCKIIDFPPQIVSMKPSDGNMTDGIDINFSCGVSDDDQLVNLTIFIWNSTNNLYYSNISFITGTQNQSSWFIQSIIQDTYKWNCKVYDNTSHYTQKPENYTLKILIRNNIFVKLVLNNTNNLVYVPGIGEQNSSNLVNQSYTNPPHYYLSSYLNGVVSGLVFSKKFARFINTGSNRDEHHIAIAQDVENSRIILVFTMGDWKVIENRIELIEAGRFLIKILPSFSYGLGNKYMLDLALGYADIDLQGRLRIHKGSHKIVIENNGTSSGKPVVIVKRE